MAAAGDVEMPNQPEALDVAPGVANDKKQKPKSLFRNLTRNGMLPSPSTPPPSSCPAHRSCTVQANTTKGLCQMYSPLTVRRQGCINLDIVTTPSI